MPNLFGRSGPFDEAIEKICDVPSENDDWQLIMNLCDQVNTVPSGHRQMAKAIIRKIRNSQQTQLLHAVTLLDACVSNCNRPFHLELCSRENMNDLKQFLVKARGNSSLGDGVRSLKENMVKWAREFGEDPQLYLMNVTIVQLKGEGVTFPAAGESSNRSGMSAAQPAHNPSISTSSISVQGTASEEEMIKRAIELSLKESQGSSAQQQNTSQIYPTFTADKPLSTDKELFKVRALYDFEAAEENEITFKTDDIISVTDNTDQNWWKGRTYTSSGLFPANFVTRDLQPAQPAPASTVSQQQPVSASQPAKVTEVNPEQIDLLLEMLKKADATITNEEEDSFLKELESNVNQQKPLIQAEFDQLKASYDYLDSVNDDMSRVVGLYHKLLKEAPPMVMPVRPPPIQYSYQPPNMAPPPQFPPHQPPIPQFPPPSMGEENYRSQFSSAYNNPAIQQQQQVPPVIQQSGGPSSPPPSYQPPPGVQGQPMSCQPQQGSTGAMATNQYQGAPISHVVPIYPQPMQYSTQPNIAHVSPMSQNNGHGNTQ